MFQLLEKNISAFVNNELERLYEVLCGTKDVLDSEEDEEKRRSSKEAFLKIMLNFMREMKQEKLADTLQSSKNI